MEENDLKQVFVGKKYQKFERKIFSLPTFFFGGIYIAYRKMLLHAILVQLIVGTIDTLAMRLEPGLMLITIICIHLAIGLYFPMWYRKYYTKQAKNVLARMDIGREEKTRIMQQKGGTSIGGIIIAIVISTVVSTEVNNLATKGFSKNPGNISINASVSSNDFTDAADKNEDKKKKDSSSSDEEGNVMKDATITGYASMMGKTTIYLKDKEGDDTQYTCKLDNASLLTCVSDYEELSVNLYYTEDKEITGFEIYDKESNKKLEGIDDIKDEDGLRELLDYPKSGSNEEKLKLIEATDTVSSIYEDDDNTKTYYKYIFETEKGKQLEFKYPSTEKELKEGKTYKAKYDVEKDFFKYEYTITEIKEV